MPVLFQGGSLVLVSATLLASVCPGETLVRAGRGSEGRPGSCRISFVVSRAAEPEVLFVQEVLLRQVSLSCRSAWRHPRDFLFAARVGMEISHGACFEALRCEERGVPAAKETTLVVQVSLEWAAY